MTLYARVRDVAAAATHRLWHWLTWAGAVGPQDRVARRYQPFGEGTSMAFPPGDVFGEEHIAIGAHSIIAAHVSLSVGMAPGQPLQPGAQSPVLRIGDRCSIGRASHLVAHRSVVIGDDVITGPSCYVTDQNHVYGDPDVPIGQQWPSEDPVVVGPGSWLGAGAVLLPGTHLGRNTVVAPAPSSGASTPTTPSWPACRPRSCGATTPSTAGSPPCATSTSCPPRAGRDAG